jgi:polysaccharide pyruvyl transferase WcaK-like protein
MRTRILFLPASQIDNAGDQLINQAAIAALRPHGEIIVDDLRTPPWFLQAIGAGPHERFSAISRDRFYPGLVKMLLKRRLTGEPLRYCLVLPPGHLFRQGLAAARVATLWHLKLLLLRVLGCTVVRAGFSIGPFDRVNLWAEKFGAFCHSFYGVRDRVSHALARSHGFRHLHCVPDLAWTFHPAPTATALPPHGAVVLSFRANATGERHSSDYLLPIRQRLRALLHATELRQRPLLVSYQVQADREAAAELLADLQDGFTVEWRAERLSIAEASALYAGAHCVISNRLHVLLLAARNNTLPVALARGADNVKITSILVDNGLDDVVIDVDRGEADNVQRLQRILAARDSVIERFSDAARDNGARVHQALAGLLARPA